MKIIEFQIGPHRWRRHSAGWERVTEGTVMPVYEDDDSPEFHLLQELASRVE